MKAHMRHHGHVYFLELESDNSLEERILKNWKKKQPVWRFGSSGPSLMGYEKVSRHNLRVKMDFKENTKVFILFDNDDYYTRGIIGVFSDKNKAQETRDKLQPHLVQEIDLDEWILEDLARPYNEYLEAKT